jgi:hypothetical protein
VNGRVVVGGLLGLVVVTGLAFWKVGLDTRDAVTAEASALGLREMSQQEVAERVAREDLFGLPSRLTDPPDRDVERAWKEATVDHPLPVSAEGVAALFQIYAVTVKGCRGLLPPALREVGQVPVWVTVELIDGVGRVTGVDGMGEGQVERPYTVCVLGGVGPAVFEAPAGGARTLAATLVVPK